jgi:cell division protein FtsB
MIVFFILRQKKDRTTQDSELTKIKEENETLKQEIDNLSTR